MYVERFDSLSLLFYLYFLPERRLIKDILNRQTLNQFTSYAKQQYPDSAELQEHLVAQLQEQHFQQYMQQMSEHTNGTFEVNGERILGANNSTNLEQGNEGDRQPANVNGLREAFGNQLNLNGATDKVDGAGNGHTAGRDEGENEDDLFDEEGDEEEDDEDYDQNKAIANASMWTRQGIATFKNTIVNELNEGVLKIGHGEIATIKVPTHPDGNCLYWEFATDDYDIGFGLLFEWKESPDTQVSIHITESDDDEDDDDFLGNCLSFGIQAFQWKLIFILVHSPHTKRRWKHERHWKWPNEWWLSASQAWYIGRSDQYYHPHLSTRLQPGGVCGQPHVPGQGCLPSQVRQLVLAVALEDDLLSGLLHQWARAIKHTMNPVRPQGTVNIIDNIFNKAIFFSLGGNVRTLFQCSNKGEFYLYYIYGLI